MSPRYSYDRISEELAERSVLGSMLHAPEALPSALFYLPGPEAFTSQPRGIAFGAIQELHAKRAEISLTAIALEARAAGLPEANVRPLIDELLQCSEAVASGTNAEHFARIVSDQHQRRRLVAAMREAESLQHADDAAERLELALRTQRGVSLDLEPIGDVLRDRYKTLEAQWEGKEPIHVAKVGLDPIDTRGGMLGGEVWILAGRPSCGKTALGMQIASTVARACEPGQVVLFFSLEMSKRELADRVFAAGSTVTTTRLRSAKIETEEWPALAAMVRTYETTPLVVIDALRRMREVIACAHRVALTRQVRLVVLDYLQLIEAPGSSREQEVSLASREMKALAKALNAPALVLSQLSRKADARSDHFPILSDLRESGSIEQDADAVMFVHREHLYDSSVDPEDAQIGLAKFRHGATGRFAMRFVAQHAFFEDRR